MGKSRSWRAWVIFIGLGLGTGLPSLGADDSDLAILQAPTKTEVPRDRPVPTPPERKNKLSLGVNYTGGQIRWGMSSRWAAEGRYQRGKASSNYGDVTSQVFGVRLYRFFKTSTAFPFYAGSELAYATAKPETSNYKTEGAAGGIFGGFEYRATKQLSLDVDIGPYAITLKETQTHQSSTDMDFILNTALILRIF